MKKHGRFRSIFLIIVITITAFIGTRFWLVDRKKEYNENTFEEKEQVLVEDAELAKKKINEEYLKTRRLRDSISNRIQIVVLTEKGSIEVLHDKTPENNKCIEWLVNSDIRLKVYYTAIFAIDTDCIMVEYNEIHDNIDVCYDLDKINVISVGIDNITSESKKSIFGSNYKPKEVTALTMIAKDKIKEEITDNNELIFLAKTNLESYLRNLACSMGIVDLSIKEI